MDMPLRRGTILSHPWSVLYAEDVYRYARLTLGDETATYDVVQVVFIRAFHAWSGYRRDANARTWPLSIARNHTYDLFRKRRTERNYLDAHPPNTPAPDESKAVHARLAVEEALTDLKLDYRQVIVLRHIEGRSVAETGEVLGWNNAKVRTTTNRALTKLREILGGDETREKGRRGV